MSKEEGTSREKENSIVDVVKTVVLGVFYLNFSTAPVEPHAVLGGLTAAAFLSGALTFMYEKGFDLQDSKITEVETE